MGIAVFPVPTAPSGLTVARFPAQSNAPFNIPAGVTLQNTITSTTTFSAGQLPAQVWAVIVGGGGGGGGGANSGGGGGGGVKIGWVDVPSGGITATIAAGGNGGAGGAFGQRGGTTVFGNIIVHGGGGGAPSGAALLDGSNTMPLGEGVPGYGGSGLTNWLINTNQFAVLSNGAPFGWNQGSISLSNTNAQSPYSSAINRGTWNNFLGGGAGGIGGGVGTFDGGSGFTGGGGGGGGRNGGNSSRNGGLTDTFTGGFASGTASGGGAGFLANGNNAGSVSGSGGLGGGGGGGSSSTGGAGGAGCVLLYY